MVQFLLVVLMTVVFLLLAVLAHHSPSSITSGNTPQQPTSSAQTTESLLRQQQQQQQQLPSLDKDDDDSPMDMADTGVIPARQQLPTVQGSIVFSDSAGASSFGSSVCSYGVVGGWFVHCCTIQASLFWELLPCGFLMCDKRLGCGSFGREGCQWTADMHGHVYYIFCCAEFD